MRHEHRSCSDGTVKHLHKPFLRAYVQISQCLQPFCFHICHFHFIRQHLACAVRDVHGQACLLVGAVCIKEGSGDVHDLFSSPHKDKPRLLCHHSHLHGLQVLLFGVAHKGLHIGRVKDHSHALLGLGDGDLCPVQSRVFLRHLVKVHPESVCQLSDGHGHAACAKVVALLDETAHLLPAEEALDLPLCGGISLLHLRAAGLDGLLCVHLGGACGAAAAVTAGAPAKEDDDVSRVGGLTDHCAPVRRSHDSPDLHSLGHVAGVVDLLYRTGGKADLVAVGAVAVGRLADKLLLGKLPFHGVLHGDSGVRRSRDAHSLVHVGTA